MIKITVITCTYNASATVGRTLQSVLCQKYQHVEHLIIDGCSKDDTLAQVEKYKSLSDNADNGHEVVIVSERDKGLYDAMNKGLQRATGDYLVFLNAGDKLPAADTLELVASSVADGERLPGVIYGNTDVVDDDGNFLCHRRLAPHEGMTWRDFRNGMLICHQAFYALTSIAREHPYDLGFRLSADVDWCISVMKQSEREGRTLRYANHVVVHYLEGGMSIQNHRASLIERFKVMRRHYGLTRTIFQHLWFVVRAVVKK